MGKIDIFAIIAIAGVAAMSFGGVSAVAGPTLQFADSIAANFSTMQMMKTPR